MGLVVIKTDRSDKTENKKFFLKISDPQQRRSRPLSEVILIPPALLVVADLHIIIAENLAGRFHKFARLGQTDFFLQALSLIKSRFCFLD